MLELLRLLKTNRVPRAKQGEPLVTLDLHPDRPIARGIAPNGIDVKARLPDDPTFEELEEAGGRVEKHSEAHVVGRGAVYVSGQIPRVTPFETGLKGAFRWMEGEGAEGSWVSEPVSCAALKLTSRGSAHARARSTSWTSDMLQSTC